MPHGDPGDWGQGADPRGGRGVTGGPRSSEGVALQSERAAKGVLTSNIEVPSWKSPTNPDLIGVSPDDFAWDHDRPFTPSWPPDPGVTYHGNNGFTPQPPTKVPSTAPKQASTTDTKAPKSVSIVSASCESKSVSGTLVGVVSVSYLKDPTDTNLASVQVWLSGYHGHQSPVLMASGSESPISFTADLTGETVKVSVVSVAFGGETAPPISSAPSVSVALNSSSGTPPAPSIAQQLVSTPVGFQFGFNVLAGLLEDLIAGYKIYRNTTNNSGTAAMIHFIAQDPTNTGVIYFQDQQPQGAVQYYWVSAVNVGGKESPLTAAQSSAVTTVSPVTAAGNVGSGVKIAGDSGQSTDSVVLGSVTGVQRNGCPDSEFKFGAAYWTLPAGATITQASGANGANQIQFAPGGNANCRSALLAVNAGSTVTVSMNVDATLCHAGDTPNFGLYYPQNSTFSTIATQTVGVAGRLHVTVTIPAGISQAQFNCGGNVLGTAFFSAPQIELGSVMTAYRPNSLDDATGGLASGIQVQEPGGVISPILLGDAHLRVRSGFDGSGRLLTGTVATPVASLDTGASRANTAIDSGNILVAGSADFARSYLNKHLGNIPDDATTGRLARRSAYISVGGSAVWLNLGTWTFPADAAGYALRIEGLGGQGYNSGNNQQAKIEILVRSGDGAIDNVAPNISGVTWIGHGNSAFVSSVKVISHGGSTAPTQNQWDVLVSVNSFSTAHWDFYCDTKSSFATNGATTTDPGAASTTVVVGAGQYVHDTSANLYGALLINGTTKSSIGLHDLHDRVAATINGYGGAGLANVPDDATSSRYAVLAIDSNRRALIDFGQTLHLGKHLGNMPDGGTRYAVVNGAGYGGLTAVASDGKLHASTALLPTACFLPTQGLDFTGSETWDSGTSKYSVQLSTAAATLGRNDGTTLAVAASSSPTAEFAATTAIYFYPRVNVSTGAVDWQGGGSTSASATLAQNCYLDGYMPANGDITNPTVTYTTGATGGGGGGGTGGGGTGGGDTCPADDQLMDARTPDGREVVVSAAEIEVGWAVRDWDGEWNEVHAAWSADGELHYVSVRGVDGQETYHVDLDHRWAIADDPDGANDDDWTISRNLHAGDGLVAADGSLVRVVDVSAPHRGRYRKLQCDRQRMRLGKLIGHNFQTS